MRSTKLNLSAIIIGVVLLLSTGCEKKEENEKPSIIFLQPDTDLIIENDTVLTFVVDAYDQDGTIDKVVFSKNGTIVHTDSNSPYKFDWNISTEDQFGIHIIKATAFDNKGAESEAEIQIEVRSYLSNWLGTYEGTSLHWSSFPILVDGQLQLITNSEYKVVSVNIIKSSQDSCLDFTITYNDSLLDTRNGLKFSALGTHFSEWGAGSGYGSLNISFDSDSLKYDYNQKCGIPCDKGIDFIINKN